MTALTNRIHLYARPEAKNRLTEFFTEILGCEPATVPGVPILAFRFSNGASVSIEFNEDAPDDDQASRVWLELKVDDPEALKSKILAAGLPQVKHPMSSRFYFQAPGGQVWGIAEL